MSCGTQVGAKEWFLRSNKGIIALRQAEYQMPWPTDHKPMRTRWVTFHEQKWVRSRERRGSLPEKGRGNRRQLQIDTTQNRQKTIMGQMLQRGSFALLRTVVTRTCL